MSWLRPSALDGAGPGHAPVVEVLTTIVFGGLGAGRGQESHRARPAVKDFLATIGAPLAAGASFKPLTGLLNDIQASSGAAAR